MIDQIEINGLKSFRNYPLKLGKLTVLTGLNNSGKSTAMQALRMCVASDAASVFLPGLGDYSEIKSDFTPPGHPIELKSSFREGVASLAITAAKVERLGGHLMPCSQFIAADRYGPRVELPTQQHDASIPTVGEKGEYAAHFASVLENVQITELLRHPNSTSNILKHQLAAWMGEVTPGVKLNFDIQPRYDSSRLEVDGKRATNSGFGISYTLPIILLLLAMTGHEGAGASDPHEKRWFHALRKNGGLLLVENPEAHLHPKGQTNLGMMFVRAMQAGLQIVVETHSDHLIDGIRLGVRQAESVLEDDACIRFFEKKSDEESNVQEIKILKNGSLSSWPAGFFDQMTKNLRALSAS